MEACAGCVRFLLEANDGGEVLMDACAGREALLKA